MSYFIKNSWEIQTKNFLMKKNKDYLNFPKNELKFRLLPKNFVNYKKKLIFLLKLSQRKKEKFSI